MQSIGNRQHITNDRQRKKQVPAWLVVGG